MIPVLIKRHWAPRRQDGARPIEPSDYIFTKA
jgi:hypothetical protein